MRYTILTQLNSETRRKINRAKSGRNWNACTVALTVYNKEIRRVKSKYRECSLKKLQSYARSGLRIHKILSNRMDLMEKPDVNLNSFNNLNLTENATPKNLIIFLVNLTNFRKIFCSNFGCILS